MVFDTLLLKALPAMKLSPFSDKFNKIILNADYYDIL